MFHRYSQFSNLPQYFKCGFFLNTWVNFDPHIGHDFTIIPFLLACCKPKTKSKLVIASPNGFLTFLIPFFIEKRRRRYTFMLKFSVFVSSFYFSRSNNIKIRFNKSFKFLTFFLRSSVTSIFFSTLLTLHRNSTVLNCHYFESKFT